MENESATGFDDVTPDPEAGQTEQTTEETAANGQTETQTDQSPAKETTFSDEDLAWAEKKGVNLEDKAAVAKMLRNADRKVSETSVRNRTDLLQAVDETTQPVAGDVVTELQNNMRVLETRFAATQYYVDNPDHKELDTEAATILRETAETDPEFARALGRNLPRLFDLAQARHTKEEMAKAKDEGRKEERKSLAGKQRASATSQAATTSAPGGEKDDFESGFDNPWSK